MRLTSRLIFSLIFSVGAVSLIFAYYQTRAETRGLERELERHALILAETLAKSAEPLVENRGYHDLQRLVDRLGIGIKRRADLPHHQGRRDHHHAHLWQDRVPHRTRPRAAFSPG